jgi:thiamine-phosphate pyrophosphorylase
MMPFKLPRVYLVTAPAGTGPAGGLAAAVEAAVRELPPGSVAVQLRAKEAGGRELLALARALRQVLDPAGQPLLVNDRVDVARASGAAGVHLPSRGVPPAEARRLLGPAALVGVSCHGVADVRRAREGGADFATFGPVFDTPSKRGFGPPVGLDALHEAAGLGLPILGLGGVEVRNARAVVAAGAWGVAAIRAWLDAPDPGRAVRELLEAVGAGGP